MASAASGANDRPGEPVSDDVIEATPHGLLDEVLARTVASDAAGAGESPVDLEPFYEVARRFPLEPLSLDPIAIELVHAALKIQSPKFAEPAEAWRNVAANVARTLVEDPVAHARLQRFWSRLNGVEP